MIKKTGPCGCPCDACTNYCEQCPPACAEGHTYTGGCQLIPRRPINTEEATIATVEPTPPPPRPYGCDGCRCWPPDPFTLAPASQGQWMPNAHCPHHGITAPENAASPSEAVGADDTPRGIRRTLEQVKQDRPHVDWKPNAHCPHHGVTPSGAAGSPGVGTDTSRRNLSTPPDGPECPPGVHSIFDPCPGGCLNDVIDDEVAESDGEILNALGDDCCGQPDACCGCTCPPQEDDEDERRRADDCGVHGTDGCIANRLTRNPKLDASCDLYAYRLCGCTTYCEDKATAEHEGNEALRDAAKRARELIRRHPCEPRRCRTHCPPVLYELAAKEAEGMAMVEAMCGNPCKANPMDCPGPDADGTCLAPQLNKESDGARLRDLPGLRVLRHLGAALGRLRGR